MTYADLSFYYCSILSTLIEYAKATGHELKIDFC